jgi:Flp pilus assembly CpaF family ATPase
MTTPGQVNGARWPASSPGHVPVTPTDLPWQSEPVDGPVRLLRERVAARLERLEVADREAGRRLTARDERARARAVLAEEVEAWIGERAGRGLRLPSAEAERGLVEAVWAALFGLGALQPLLEREDVENIHIHGHDRIALELADGRVEWWPYPVAASDADLVRLIAEFAARLGQTGREFSTATPMLNLRLPAGGPLGARLAAAMEVCDRPRIAIRRHRLVEVSLDDLAGVGTLSPGLAAFLRAAVRAGVNLVVSGGPAAGKTTLLRALCGEIAADEHVVTIEEEYELGLHLMPGRHRLVTPLEARYPNAEGAGGIDLHALVNQALRQSPHRVIVGEVRGGEVTAMLRALGNGAAGGMCTLHAASATAVFDRIASLGQLADPPMPVDAAYRWTAQAIDLVVHIRRTDHNEGGGRARRERFVDEVLAVGPVGDSGRPDITRLYRPRAGDGHAEPDVHPDQRLLTDLVRCGFDPAWLGHEGEWSR